MAQAVDDSDPLLQRALAGDRAALAQAYQQFRKRLRQSVAMRLDERLAGRVDPSDVVQETFVDVVRRWDEYAQLAERMPLFLWFRLLAAQRLIDLQRQHLGAQMRDVTLEVSLDRPDVLCVSSAWLVKHLIDRQQTGSSAAVHAEIRQRVQQALEAMDPVDREILAMRHFEEMTNREVAAALGLSKSAASNRYLRALERLGKILTPDVSTD